MPGPYVYANVDDLEGQPLVSLKSCASLIQWYTKPGLARTWTEGVAVKGNTTIAKGTAVATFVDGKYENLPHGNHAAFYISQDATGVKVMDQWADDPKKPTISSRVMRFKGKDRHGKFIDASNNGDALSIIM